MIKEKAILTINRLTLTLAAFIFAQLFLLAILSFSNSRYTDPLTWFRWDSGHYISIAENGYEYFSCAGLFGYPEDTKEMCGNCGWFPAYPLMIKYSDFVFHDEILTGGLISKLFYFLALFMILVIANIRKFTFRHFLFLTIASLFFGFVYYNAVFPISAVLFFTLAAFYVYLKGNFWLTGLFCMLASFLYPTGILLSLVIASAIFITERTATLSERIRKGLIPFSMGLIGLAVVFINFQVQVGEWSAFLKIQAKYGHGLQNPIKKVVGVIEKFNTDIFSADNFSTLQSLIVLAGFIIVTRQLIRKKLNQNKLYILSYCWVAIYFLSPWLLGGNLSFYRAESLLLPGIFLLKDLKTKWFLLILLILMTIGGPMSYFFFTSKLI